MWHQLAYLSFGWFPKSSHVCTMYSSPNLFLRAMTMEGCDSFCGRLLTTMIVLMQSSNGEMASLSHVTLTLSFS
jgi:hypothetical protein